MTGPSRNVLSLNRLAAVVRRLRRKGKTIAFTNGCFDLLHAGHLDYLERIKSKSDCLIVAVNSDSSVKKIKGPGRPILPAKERAALVAALKPVDYVTIFSEPTPLKTIRLLKPDLLAKGGDWKPDQIVGRKEVESRGGRVLVVPTLKGHSTSGLIQRIRKAGMSGS